MTQSMQSQNQDSATAHNTDRASTPNFVAFRVAAQHYCVDIHAVREITGWTQATPLPKSEHYIRGVINLRGSVVPVLDCRLRFGLQTCDPRARQVIIGVQLGERLLGLLVDEVTEILNIPQADIRPVSDADVAPTALVTGMILLKDRMISLVNLAQIAPVNNLAAA